MFSLKYNLYHIFYIRFFLLIQYIAYIGENNYYCNIIVYNLWSMKNMLN